MACWESPRNQNEVPLGSLVRDSNATTVVRIYILDTVRDPWPEHVALPHAAASPQGRRHRKKTATVEPRRSSACSYCD
jgi:hypothetical protein